jgi:hypothetical protein
MYNLKFTIIALTCTLFIVHCTFTQSAIAVESTPSADVKSKLEILKQEIASKAAKLKSEINKSLQNKAYIGVIKSKSENTLTLASRSGTKIVNINQDTVYEPKITKASPLKEEANIAALGDVDETGVLTARKIVVIPTPKTPTPKTYVLGQVLSISDDLITIKDNSNKNIAISDKTDVPVKENQFIIATGIVNKNNILEAKFIYNTATPSGIKR